MIPPALNSRVRTPMSTRSSGCSKASPELCPPKGNSAARVGHIDAEGDFDVPDFKVSGSAHEVHLASNFHAVIDGTNGDTYLTRVESHFGRTTVISQGDVKGHPGQHGKTVMLTMSVSQGRIEDLLRLFTGSARPAETGDVRLQTKVELPPGPQAFLRRLRLDGELRNRQRPLHRP